MQDFLVSPYKYILLLLTDLVYYIYCDVDSGTDHIDSCSFSPKTILIVSQSGFNSLIQVIDEDVRKE